MRLRCVFFFHTAFLMLFRCSFYPISLLVILMIMAHGSSTIQCGSTAVVWRLRFCIVLLSSSSSFSFPASLLFTAVFLLYSKYRWYINFGSPFHTISLFLFFRLEIDLILLISNEQQQRCRKEANRKCLCVCVWKMMLDVELSMFLLWRYDCQW